MCRGDEVSGSLKYFIRIIVFAFIILMFYGLDFGLLVSDSVQNTITIISIVIAAVISLLFYYKVLTGGPQWNTFKGQGYSRVGRAGVYLLMPFLLYMLMYAVCVGVVKTSIRLTGQEVQKQVNVLSWQDGGSRRCYETPMFSGGFFHGLCVRKPGANKVELQDTLILTGIESETGFVIDSIFLQPHSDQQQPPVKMTRDSPLWRYRLW